MPEKNTLEYGDGFLRDVRKLPRNVQDKLADLLEILINDTFDPRLHTKPLSSPLVGKYSFRITRDWRVGFEFSAEHSVKLLIADHRDRIYKHMKRMG